MYWCVGAEQSGACPQSNMEAQDGDADMGSKQSTLGSVSAGQCPGIENIQAAYKEGDSRKALELIKSSCEENLLKVEKCQLLSIAAVYNDLEAVNYLLQDALVELPLEPTDDNPAVVAAYFGQKETVKVLLESLAGHGDSMRLLNWMLAVACQQAQLEVVKLLVLEYDADPNCCAEKKNEFPNLRNVPFYAAMMAGSEEIAIFLLQNGARFCSYALMDNPQLTKLLLRKYFTEPAKIPEKAQSEPVTCVRWAQLKLPWFEVDWVIDISRQIVELDLSGNCLTALPSIIPWGLIHLQRLHLNDNQLTELPSVKSSDEVLCTRLLELDLSSNRLSCLSTGILHLTSLRKLAATKNFLEKLFDEENATNWIGLRKLQELDVSDNQLTELPASFVHCFKSLNNLTVSKNKLKVFPEPWACPLKYFRASKNGIEFLPDTLSIFWKNHMKEVDLSENCLKDLPAGLFQLENLVSLRLSGNQLVSWPSPDKWTCKLLKCLDFSKNQLGKNDDATKTKRILFFSTKSRARAGTETGCLLELPLFLSESMEVLYLNDNQLEAVPPSVCQMKNLTELYLGNNPGIRELPAELGQLAGLWQLDIEELNISNLPAEVRTDGPGAVLAYLRAQLRKAERCKLVKMIIVGPPRQGKSTLLEVLQTGKPAQLMSCDTTITTTRWELQRPAASKAKIDSVTFNVWDIGGPASMSTVNQCFFTDKALYVVVWNLALGEEAVAKLQFWLLNIEAKAPNAAVIVIGTHLDFIDTKFRLERIATLRAHVLALCRSPSGSRATGYPDITFKHLHELSCKSLEGSEGLRTLIFNMACTVKDVGSTISSQRLVGRLVPRSYLNLQEAILAEHHRRSQNDDVQYLTDLQIEQIIEQSPGNDIRDYEDLQAAISFLIETGTLLHFPDTSHGLRNLYFLDPVWLAECLERIINIKSSRSVAKNGVIKAEDLRMLLVGTGFTEQTEEQYFQFLSKFEIALPVANNRYLLPHLLPAKPGLDIHGLRHPTVNSVQRLFKMSFVPVGFWQRFIARMLISLAEMDLQLFENRKNAKSRNRKVTVYSFTGNHRNRCSTFRVKRTQTIYWQEGLLVTFEGGYLSVESSVFCWNKKKSEGIKLICQSEMRDFSAMAFITDHVNSLIDQWFPALTATESDGTLLMEQYIPCHICSSPDTGPEESDGRTEGGHYFNVEHCVLSAIEQDFVTCPNHPEIAVPLRELVPELFMTDFPARLFLEDKDLEYSESENNILGQGGSGTIIYRAQYQGKPVAVKRFIIKKCRSSADASVDTMFRHLQAMEAMRNFSEFRQEASMLHSLTHPCIVALIGICIHPLCFALELAPLGSLNSVISEHAKGSSFMPLGHMLTQRVAYQIAAGLAYLHKKNIIFCDLKSDNILVWSLDVTEYVNVKLSDYGISRQSFHEGALGVEGTPGYQAPEIKPRIVYDEKVDMFSYGMVLYELLSGQRPALGQHQLQIAKKLSKGIRPILGQPEEVQFLRLQGLMMECWDTKPEKRPFAASVVWRMKDPSFAAFMYLLPCGKQDSFFSSQGPEHTVVFWDGKEHERNYTVANTEKGLLEVQRMNCPGMKICHQLKVQNALWTATADQKIYVYGLQGMCPLNSPEKVLDTPAIVTFFLTFSVVKKSTLLVFAGLSDGLVAVFPVVDGIPTDNVSYICSHTANRSMFKIADDDPRQNPYPVKAMQIPESSAEVWYNNGPGILIIDCVTMEITKRLEPFMPPSAVTSIVCSLGCNGEELVWCLDDRTNSLVMFHSATYQLCARYCCGDGSPLRDTFTVQLSPEKISDGRSTISSHRKGPESNSPMDLTIIVTEEGGTQMLSHQDSLTDYVSISSSYSSSPPNRITPSSSSLLSSPVSSSSLPFSTDCEEPALELNVGQTMSESSETATTESEPGLQATKILAVKDLLWVPRHGGDIIVIGLEKEAGTQRGRVIAVLKASEMELHGRLVDAAVVAKDTVVCCFAKENKERSLAVWRGWSAKDFDVFYRGFEELGRLETRRRR